MARRDSKLGEGFKHGILLFVLAFAFYPMLLTVIISFKSNEQYEANPWFFDAVSTWRWDNWAVAWHTVSPYIANSIFVSVTQAALSIVMVVVTAYVLARYSFPGRNIVYYSVIASMFVPGSAASLVTLFWLLKNMGLVNSLWALILVGACGGQVGGIFIIRQFIEDIPKELFESAQIEGAGHLSQIRHVVLPMSMPIISTVLILDFLGSWNDVIFPLVVLRDDDKLTIPVGLLRFEGEYVKQWGQMMAGYAIASVPLVLMFLFTMRLFVRGLAAGAVKG